MAKTFFLTLNFPKPAKAPEARGGKRGKQRYTTLQCHSAALTWTSGLFRRGLLTGWKGWLGGISNQLLVTLGAIAHVYRVAIEATPRRQGNHARRTRLRDWNTVATHLFLQRRSGLERRFKWFPWSIFASIVPSSIIRKTGRTN